MFDEKLLITLRRDRFTPRAVASYVRGSFGRVRGTLEDNPDFIRSLLGNTLLLFGILFALSAWVSISIGRTTGLKFLLWSSAWLAIAFLWSLVHAALSRDRDGSPVHSVTVPNLLSLFRLSLVPGVFFLVTRGHAGEAMFLFAVGALSDIADGLLARRLAQQTRLGTVMDPLVDVAFNMSAVWALSLSGSLPMAISLLLSVRYALLLGGAAYVYIFRGPLRIRPTLFGRLSAVFLSVMVFLCMYVYAYGTVVLRERLTGVLEAGLAILISATIIHVAVMGAYSLRQYPHAPQAAP
jgi:cardiolipin synthase